MARWNEVEYVERAGRIAHDHAISKKSLNDLSEKVARDENLQPDEIRTLVRLANVATFQELFKRKDDGDKMIEFEAGDPEAVIHRIVDSASQAPQTANIHNDKLASAWEAPDLMMETRLGHKFDVPVQEKTASDVGDTPRPMRRDLAVLAMRKLAAEFEVERISAGQRWEAQMDKLAAEFRKAPGYGPAFTAFEKDAFADYGVAVLPELTCLRASLKLAAPLVDVTKVASLQERHITEDTPQLRLLKEAVDIRDDYEKFDAGLTWIKKNSAALGV